MSLADVALAQIGEHSRAIIGPAGAGTEASIYAQVQGVVIRVSVLSDGVDPLAVAQGVTIEIVQRMG